MKLGEVILKFIYKCKGPIIANVLLKNKPKCIIKLNKYTLWNRKMGQWKAQKQTCAYRDIRCMKYCCHMPVGRGWTFP